MKHFIFLIAAVFSGMVISFLYREDSAITKEGSVLKVYASTSFSSQWGPGPQLKEIFEKQTSQKITFIDMNDPSLTFQKMNFDGASAIGDVVIGLDQLDLIKSKDKIKWKILKPDMDQKFSANLPHQYDFENFIAYDWAPITFVARSNFKFEIKSLDDLFKTELKNQILADINYLDSSFKK